MLEHKTILVLGAAGLLGRSVTKGVLSAQGNVIACDLTLTSLTENFEQSEVLTFEQLDVTNELQVKSFFDNIAGIDGVVNCTYPRNQNYGAHFFDVTLADFNENLSSRL